MISPFSVPLAPVQWGSGACLADVLYQRRWVMMMCSGDRNKLAAFLFFSFNPHPIMWIDRHLVLFSGSPLWLQHVAVSLIMDPCTQDVLWSKEDDVDYAPDLARTFCSNNADGCLVLLYAVGRFPFHRRVLLARLCCWYLNLLLLIHLSGLLCVVHTSLSRLTD